MKLIRDEKGWRTWLRAMYKKPDFTFKPPTYPVYAYFEGEDAATMPVAAYLTPSELLMMVVELYNAAKRGPGVDAALPIVEDLVLTFRAEHGRDPKPGDTIVWPSLSSSQFGDLTSGVASGDNQRP